MKIPSTSWGVITGSNKELHNAVKDNRQVNQAIHDLNSEKIKETYEILLTKYK